ncbi:unnamed protein product [Brugia pahangi]|uniref:F-box domain-containing protein n=1 Tax=Brugia pahangi TaxID=6280 RepID=A0A0N4T9R8_BRUPA|nr:unnamed protein product [Brugia pahangi]
MYLITTLLPAQSDQPLINRVLPKELILRNFFYKMYLITTLLPAQSDQPLINRVLPKELILRIFSFLDITSLCRCAQTCRHWNLLALDGSNWQQVDLFQFQKDIKNFKSYIIQLKMIGKES